MRAKLGRSGIVAAGLIGLFMSAGSTANSQNADPISRTDSLGLVDAARTQDPNRVRALLASKADVNARSDEGSTALLWVAHWNDVETARRFCPPR